LRHFCEKRRNARRRAVPSTRAFPLFYAIVKTNRSITAFALQFRTKNTFIVSAVFLISFLINCAEFAVRGVVDKRLG